jgi:DNA-binding response OmpR family regulator
MDTRILVIEDEPELRQMILDLLEASGFLAVGVDRPEFANSVAAGEHPDLFIVDLMLPGLNGIELAKDLRAHGYERTPMIAISASRSMLESAEESRLFQEMLRKPFDVMSLIDCVERYAA